MSSFKWPGENENRHAGDSLKIFRTSLSRVKYWFMLENCKPGDSFLGLSNHLVDQEQGEYNEDKLRCPGTKLI